MINFREHTRQLQERHNSKTKTEGARAEGLGDDLQSHATKSNTLTTACLTTKNNPHEAQGSEVKMYDELKLSDDAKAGIRQIVKSEFNKNLETKCSEIEDTNKK